MPGHTGLEGVCFVFGVVSFASSSLLVFVADGRWGLHLGRLPGLVLARGVGPRSRDSAGVLSTPRLRRSARGDVRAGTCDTALRVTEGVGSCDRALPALGALEVAVEGEELLEACAAAGELGGAALEGDAAVFDEDDAVHALDAGQVVGDHHHAAAF